MNVAAGQTAADQQASDLKKAVEGDEGLGPSPSRIRNDRLRHEAERAAVWVSVIGLFALAIYIAQPLLVIFGALVFAAMIDGGARLLGRVLPIGRAWRVAVVCLLVVLFLAWLVMFTGTQISREAAAFPNVVQQQFGRLLNWAEAQGFEINPAQVQSYAGQLMGGVGTLANALGGVLGAFSTLLLIAIVGIYVAFEPRLYERGVGWMFSRRDRPGLYVTLERMASTMRRLMAGRLLGMLVEGIVTYILLAWYGVPLAALLAILTGLLAFIPNVGAIVSGLLMVLVGFSGGVDMGLYTILVYLLVQSIDGYVLVPIIARRTVDLAPALVLAMQLVMGVLFGILGLFLADPLLAMIKVMLERRAETAQQSINDGSAPAPAG